MNARPTPEIYFRADFCKRSSYQERLNAYGGGLLPTTNDRTTLGGFQLLVFSGQWSPPSMGDLNTHLAL